MKKIVLLLIILVAAGGIYWTFFKKEDKKEASTKEIPIKQMKHSKEFNASIDSVMTAYFNMRDAFVEADTLKAKESCKNFIALLERIPVDELKKDSAAIYETAISTINDVKSNAMSLLNQHDITTMRQDFRSISDMLFPAFFTVINYEGPKIFLQNCPMAFGEEKEANWISDSREIVNPYLGKFDPKYKATMLNCGEVKDSMEAK